MDIGIGEKGLDLTFQQSFPKETICTCSGTARIAMVVAEEQGQDEYICSLHDNDGKGGYWPHDAVAIAVYFCKDCFKAVTLWNQG